VLCVFLLALAATASAAGPSLEIRTDDTVILKDGEKLVGSTLGYEPNRPGFFIHPADDKSNNIRVFVVQAFVDKVRNL
jgi:hypothetical protein